ncbi:hypothetical protein Tco_0769899 [Tanacetum coccineum]|uniref:Uncharacterized protein n=1 Tax=Tanacetum coccineum TaxID=301880 RepID=A0ABQ4ZEK9_9ASTR
MDVDVIVYQWIGDQECHVVCDSEVHSDQICLEARESQCITISSKITAFMSEYIVFGSLESRYTALSLFDIICADMGTQWLDIYFEKYQMDNGGSIVLEIKGGRINELQGDDTGCDEDDEGVTMRGEALNSAGMTVSVYYSFLGQIEVEMFDINDLHGDDVDMPVGEKHEQSAKGREVNTSVEDSSAPTTIKEITLAQTLIQINAAKPKVVTTAATTTTTRPNARGVVVQEPSEFRTPQESQPSMIKDKGKAIMIEPEVPPKRKDQVALDEDLARNLQAQLEAELIEEERLARKQEKEANIALIESRDNIQAMIEADFVIHHKITS